MRTQVMDDLKKLFTKNQVWTLRLLAEQLNYSEISVRRFLKRMGYVRSYTHNGKFYTLHTIAQFNSQGIWRHEQTRFSKHGTLIQTINHLIHKSPMGLSASELASILDSPCQSFLSNQYKAGKLDRVKPGPEYIYLAEDSKTKHRQKDLLNKRFAREDQSLFLYHRNSREVCQDLIPRGIKISPREVDYLGQRFIIFLALAHRKCSPRIRELMQDRGGYIFHLDGTCDGSSPHLMSGLDSISEIVLANTKLATENSDQIIPFLQDRIQKVFGDPLAVVTDMGAGILKAVEHVFEGVIHLICHFHFLRDIGKDLLKADYDMVQKRLKKHAIVTKLKRRARLFEKAMDNKPDVVNAFVDGLDAKQLSESMASEAMVACAYTLIQWTLAGKKQGQGYGFPFDRVHIDFAQRLYHLQAYLKHFKRASSLEYKVLRPFNQLMGDLIDLGDDAKLKKALREIDGKIQVFETLRTAMRIAPTDGKQGLNFNGTDVNLKTIKKRVTHFCDHLKSDQQRYDRQEYKKMIAQIEKYWDKLFADPITVQTNKGKVTIVPQRTNNIMEQLFRDHKKSHCRKTGNSRMDKALQTVLADTPLIKNLENEKYMTILLDGKETLEDVFAEIDIKVVRDELAKAQQDFNKIPVKLRKIISHAQLPERVAEMLKVPKMAKAS